MQIWRVLFFGIWFVGLLCYSFKISMDMTLFDRHQTRFYGLLAYFLKISWRIDGDL